MTTLSKAQFISSITSLERLYLLETDNGGVYLRGDIEYGGDLQIPRVEMMCFDINTELPIDIACSECRSRYIGGITFIEYDDEADAIACALDDFLNLEKDAIYLSCDKNELTNISDSFEKAFIYTVIEIG